MWLLLLFHFFPVLLPFLLFCSKSPAPSDRSKENISNVTRTIRRDLADNHAPSVQGSVAAAPDDGVSVMQSVYRCPSMSGQRPKTRQVPMSDSARERFNKEGSQMRSIQMSSQQLTPGDSVQLSAQQPVSGDPSYFHSSEQSQMASVAN